MRSTPVFPSLRDSSAILRTYGAQPFHTDNDLLSFAFAPDGTLWSVEDGGVLRHWDLAARKQLGWLPFDEPATTWCFNPDAKLVAAGSNELTMWDLESGDALAAWTWPQQNWVTAIAFHPRLDRLATGHDGSVVCIWDLHQRDLIAEISGRHAAISAVAFSPDGTKLAWAEEDKAIHLWDLEHDRPCGYLLGHNDRIPALAWHPDGNRLLSAGWDATVRVWNVQKREPIVLLNSHAPQVLTMALSRDGSRLACADSANAVHLWDLESYRTIGVCRDQANEIRGLAFSSDGHKLAFGGVERVIHVWDAPQLPAQSENCVSPASRSRPCEENLADPLMWRSAVSLLSGGKQLASLIAGASLQLWDVEGGDNVLPREDAGVTRTFATSADGEWVAASQATETAALVLWHAATGKRHKWLEGPDSPSTALAFAPDSTLLASASHQTVDVWLWQVPSGEPALLIRNATEESCSVEALAWHPQGRILACAGIDCWSTSGIDGWVTLWDVSERKSIRSFPGGATAVTFHPSGKMLAAATLKNTVRVWDIESEKPRVAFHPSGMIAAETGHTSAVSVEDVELEVPALELIGHCDAVTCLAYSPDGRVLATGGDDNAVRLWDAESGDELAVIELDTQIKALVFSPDGHFLYTGNGNTSCYQLDVRQC